LTVYGRDIDAVTNPNPEDEVFIQAVADVFDFEVRVALSLPLYKIYDNKLSRDFRAVFQVSDPH